MYFLDSVHVWHVSEAGNDSNGGQAQQYPIDLAADAFLTIGQAVTDAADGDTVIVWPGTYAENVDLDAADKGLVMIGTHRDLCVISPADDNALDIESNTHLYNLSFVAAGAGNRGIYGSIKSNITIDNCYCYGPYDGIYIVNSSDVLLKDTHAKSDFDGANLNHSDFLRAERCIFESDGSDTAVAVAGVILTNASNYEEGYIFRDCDFKVVRTAASALKATAVSGYGDNALFENCRLTAITKSSATGDAIGLGAGLSTYTSRFALMNCGIYTSSNGGDAYDIQVAAAAGNIVNAVGCTYDTSKISGTVVQVNSGWAAGVNAEVDTALDTAVPGSPTADSINERVKAIDVKLPSSTYLRGTADSDGGLCAVDKTDINTEVDNSIATNQLDHLAYKAGGTIIANSILAKLVSKSATANWSDFDNTTDSLQAIRDKEDSVKLASDGLDSVSTTEPSGVASNFREMLVQVWRRFFKKTTATSSQLKTYVDAGTVGTTQTVDSDGTTKTVGNAS